MRNCVLSYGCIYQGGFIYSVDDTTSNTGSIGGKVLALTDQKPSYPSGIGIAWDAAPACNNDPYECKRQTEAWDSYEGSANTSLIVSVLNGQNENKDNPANYAAAVCTTYTDGAYDDWYLAAHCEMGPNGNGYCRAGTPNIVDNLGLLLGDPNTNSCSYGTNCLTGAYWSSTEDSLLPHYFVWYETFASGDGSTQFVYYKNFQFGVRCSRGFK